MCASPHAANFLKRSLAHELRQVTERRPFGDVRQVLVFLVRNALVLLDEGDRLSLALVQPEPIHDSRRQPVSPQRDDEFSAALPRT